MKILVEHEVPCEKGMEQKCLYPGDYWGNDVCRYHTHRDRTHGRKAPVERHLPKCTLFDEWLPGEYLKCEKCMASVTASRRSHEPIPLKELREMNEPNSGVVGRGRFLVPHSKRYFNGSKRYVRSGE